MWARKYFIQLVICIIIQIQLYYHRTTLPSMIYIYDVILEYCLEILEEATWRRKFAIPKRYRNKTKQDQLQVLMNKNQTTWENTWEYQNIENKYEVKVYLMHFIFLFYSRKPTPESMPTWIVQICFQRKRIKLLSYKTYKMESYLQKMKLYRKKWHHHCRLFIFTKNI